MAAEVTVAAQRSGYDAACLKHIATAGQHVKALFLGTDGASPIPELQAEQSLMLRCLNRASAHSQLMWAAAQGGDAAYTHKCGRAWYKAVKAALEQVKTEMPQPVSAELITDTMDTIKGILGRPEADWTAAEREQIRLFEEMRGPTAEWLKAEHAKLVQTTTTKTETLC